MSSQIDLEIHFYGEIDVAVQATRFEADSNMASLFFALFSIRQLVNIAGSDQVASSLARLLTQTRGALSELRSDKETENTKIVDYPGHPGEKSFIAAFSEDGDRFNFALEPKGFGLFARGIDYFAATSVFVLLRSLLRRLDGDPLELQCLGFTAEGVGNHFLGGQLGATNQNDAAFSVWSDATEDALKVVKDALSEIEARGEARSDESLSERYWELDADARQPLIQPYFLEKCVDGIAQALTPGLLEQPGVDAAFQVRGGAKFLAAELGAAVIEGYLAAWASFGPLPTNHPITQFGEEKQERLWRLIEDRWKELEPTADISDELNELLAELVTLRLNKEDYYQVEGLEKIGNYLFAAIVNGVCWARAEKQVVG